jgi:hypothetical protein
MAGGCRKKNLEPADMNNLSLDLRTVHPLDLIRSTPSLIGPGYPLSLKHHPHKAVYVSAILFNVGVDFERSNLKST